ncbi:MAG: PD40 domain-containing protein [Coriobacteriales bacterium]|nr:PD40 domain-containing protein [Coriobacteriales bacterium]
MSRFRTAVCAVALVTFMSPTVAPALAIPQYEVPMVETRLTDNGDAQYAPAISGSNVVYHDMRNGNFDVYAFDLSSGVESRLTTSTADQWFADVSGDLVVWTDMRNGPDDVYSHDLATGTESRITNDGADQNDPAVSGSTIAFADNRNGNWDVYTSSAAGESRLTTSSADQFQPDISGRIVVWTDLRNGNAEIYAMDLQTGEERRLTTDGSEQSAPAVSGNRVVYQDNRNLNWEIYSYDLATDTETRVTNNILDQLAPAISGSRAVWLDYRNIGTDIYCYDFASEVEKRLTEDDANPMTGLAIDGDATVNSDNRNLNRDIYLGNILAPRLTAGAEIPVAYNTSTSIWGALTSASGTGLSGRSVVLESSTDGLEWTAGAPSTTSGEGAFSSATPALTTATWFRTRFVGDEEWFSALSAPILVKPCSGLGTPVARSKMTKTKTYTIYGGLKPHHTAGASAGRVYAYRKQSGSWVLRKTFTTTAYDYSTYSRYRASVKLPYSGSWRMRAYHSDGGHATTYSNWRYATVK